MPCVNRGGRSATRRPAGGADLLRRSSGATSSVLAPRNPDLSIHRCAALTAAGLATDAMQEADAAISQLDRIHGRPTKRAELLLTAATCALAAGQPGAALDRATEARQLFDRQGRRWWRAHAQLAQVSAGVDTGPATAALLRDARAVRPGADRCLLARRAAGAAGHRPGGYGARPDDGVRTST